MGRGAFGVRLQEPVGTTHESHWQPVDGSSENFVSSYYGDPTPVRGGRPKRFFKVERPGVAAVKRSVQTVTLLAAGLESILGVR